MKATVILVPLLGFTWIIGLFAVGEEGRIFAYLFVIGNVFQVRETTSCSIYATVKKEDSMRAVIPCMNAHSFLHTSYVRMYVHLYIQGLFIFLLHVLRHEKVYGKIKDKLPNISKLVSIVTYIYIHNIYIIYTYTYIIMYIYTYIQLSNSELYYILTVQMYGQCKCS